MSKKTLFSLFAVCAIPIYFWSIYNLFHEIPSWILRLSSWEIIGITAYVQVFTLLESIIIFFSLILLTKIIPFRKNERTFTAQIALAYFLVSLLLVFAHTTSGIIRTWGIREFIPASLGFILLIGSTFLIVKRFNKLERVLLNIIERLEVLTVILIVMGISSFLIVIIRNI
jgi:hypothetical protein